MTAEPTARELALAALLDRKGMVVRHLHRRLDERSVSPAEAALATQLTCGVVRRRRTLDAILSAYSALPGKAQPPAVREILRLAVYQIAFLNKIPNFAAVNEAVSACRKRHPRLVRFVNAVCRSIARGLSDERAGAAPLTGRAIAVTPDCHRVGDRQLLGLSAGDPAVLLADLCSLPDELAQRWCQRAGSPERAFAAAMQVNAPPVIVARVNPVQTTVPRVLEMLAEAGVQAVAHSDGRSIVFVDHVSVADLEVFRRGLITPQDATAANVVPALEVAPGMRVLDLGAAPGTKTTQLGELMGGRGEIVAVDVSSEKLSRIEAGARRCRLDNVRTCLAGDVVSLSPASFDRVLVDAPCSNTGVLARRVEARWRFRADRLNKLATDQRRILAMAAAFLTPGGRLLYSTCSLEPEENQRVVHAVVNKHRHLKLVAERGVEPLGFAPPHEVHDGGYHAVLLHE